VPVGVGEVAVAVGVGVGLGVGVGVFLGAAVGVFVGDVVGVGIVCVGVGCVEGLLTVTVLVEGALLEPCRSNERIAIV